VAELVVVLLSRRYRHRQPVFFRRQGAGGIRSYRAGRIVRAVRYRLIVSAAVQWAERIVRKIDNMHAVRGDGTDASMVVEKNSASNHSPS
jgi:hypothetical protein